MKKMKFQLLIILLSFCHFAIAQTADDEFFLNIVEPFYESIPSSEIGGAQFGGSITAPLYGDLAYALNATDTMACDWVFDLTGKIALADRGNCEFVRKAFNAQASGAIALIICNTDDEIVNMAEGEALDVNIPVILIKQSHCQTLKVVLNAGQSVFLGLSPEPNETSSIEGSVAYDENENCTNDAGENTLANFKVSASKTNYTRTTYTDNEGNYNLFLDTGNYILEVIPPSQVWENCLDPVNVDFDTYDELITVDFPLQAYEDCALLTVDIASPLLRRCFENNYKISYCNLGNIAAMNAYIELNLDPLFTIVSSSIPFTQNNNLYTFDLGNLNSGFCGDFTYVAELSCDAELGMTFCSQANIFPFDRGCLPTVSNWDGSNIVVTGRCNEDELRFDILNDSEDAMLVPLSYDLIRNDLYTDSGSFLLEAGASKSITVPADGATYRIQAQQAENHPWNNLPSATVEACTNDGDFETGFHPLFPVADYGDSYDELCQEVIGSWDPNDKQGFPLGYGDQHYIEKNVDLRYLIRFQNTGTDTAFKVIVTDEISEHLDMRSFKPGASSHPYKLDITNNSLQFTFDNIMLPDSFVNEPASNGWFEYEIAQKADLALETRVENTAAIYFDFNEPVITNTVYHTVGENFLVSSLKEVLINKANLQLHPNPAQLGQSIFIQSTKNSEANFQLFNIQGQEVLKASLAASHFTVPEDLEVGFYILKITHEDGKVETGRLLIH